MEETDHEGPTSWPACIGLELAKGKPSASATIMCDDKHADEDCKDTSKGEVDGQRL